MHVFTRIAIVLGVLSAYIPTLAQKKSISLENTAFSDAVIQWNTDTELPGDIKLNVDSKIGKDAFFDALSNTFNLPEQLQFIPISESSSPVGDEQIRYTLKYRGLELSKTQFILHLKDNRVVHAHGRLVDPPDMDINPILSKQEAFTYACNHFGIPEKEARRNSKLQSVLSAEHGIHEDDGRLIFSSGYSEKKGENYRLAYRFDITTTDPWQRFDVDIDARTGELIGKYPTLYHENIITRGRSLYYDTVDIVVSDSSSLSEWANLNTNWHLDTWNAYQDSGMSWWLADTASFSPGGYLDYWHEALITDPIILSGPNPRLEFIHRYNLESPDGASDYNDDYDGWDGINVRISLDQGVSWRVLKNPEPAYTCNSLWSFGGIHNEGPGIQGWAGKKTTWDSVLFDLSNYNDDTVLIRFEFASDGGYSSFDDNNLFGWQIDDIKVLTDSTLLFSNSGDNLNMHVQNLFQWVGRIAGTYRLRETTRGSGIATINASNGMGFSAYMDYVQDSLPVLSDENMVGVGIHWASEQTYDFFLETFGRKSYDNREGAIISYADWMLGDERTNAFWSGNYAAYGAGDGEEYSSFGAIDVVGHEITHGVTQYSANLVYQGEPGALNESFSDIFGTAVEFYTEGMEKGDWLCGEDFVIGPDAYRSMEDPKRYECPDTYLGEYWFNTEEKDDYGGVHTNSGVQNHWFYLLSEGGAGINDDDTPYQVSGIGLNDATAIAYRNLTLYLIPDSKYHDAALYSIQAAEDLFGVDSPQVHSTIDAWEAVGIYRDPRLVSRDSLLLFETPLGSSETVEVALQNKGMAPITISDIQFSDTVGYSISSAPSLPLELESLKVTYLRVKFTPEFEGLHQSTLSILSNDSRDSILEVRLSGQGLAPTGVPEAGLASSAAKLSIYPNPTNNLLTVETEISGFYQIQITSLNGQLILNRKMKGNTLQIDLSSFQKGVYFITIRSKDFITTRKIVKL